MLIKTDKNSVIGGYNPDQWEDTTGKKNSYGYSDRKDITSGLPFLFYWVNGQIQIIKHKNDKIPSMKSNKDWIMVIDSGIAINADKNQKS